MRFLRLQRSQANRRRAEREAERVARPDEHVRPDDTAREYPAPAEPVPGPGKRKSG